MTRLLTLGALFVGAACLAFGQSGIGLAGGGAAPEIDPGQAVTALAFFSGTAYLIRNRRKK